MTTGTLTPQPTGIESVIFEPVDPETQWWLDRADYDSGDSAEED